MSGSKPAGPGVAPPPPGDAEITEPAPSRGDEPAQAADDAVDDVPDPDEDDLDDLDDMLDDFSAVTVDPNKTQGRPREPGPEGASGAAVAAEPRSEPGSTEDLLSDDDFAKQLQAGMADLLGDIQTTPEIQAQWQSMFNELGGAAASSQPGPSGAQGAGLAAKAATAAGTEESFQETIRKTLERMQASGDQATAAASAEGSDDFLAELLKQMQAGGLEGEGNEEEFSKMLMGMMDQLTHKEILYEPMKELNGKFPEWLLKNKDKTSKEDLQRYEEQQAHVKEIVLRFEQPGYADSNAADREFIVDRMQKMQAAGSPPADLVGDMPSAQDALNMPGCNTQ